jgi:hypothetical protein
MDTDCVLCEVKSGYLNVTYKNVSIQILRLKSKRYKVYISRSQWPRSLRRTSTAAHLPRLWDRILEKSTACSTIRYKRPLKVQYHNNEAQDTTIHTHTHIYIYIYIYIYIIPLGAWILSVVCCQVEVSATIWSLVQRSPTTVARRCVWSRNLVVRGHSRICRQWGLRTGRRVYWIGTLGR